MADTHLGPKGERLMANVYVAGKVYGPKADPDQKILGPGEFFKDCKQGKMDELIAAGHVFRPPNAPKATAPAS